MKRVPKAQSSWDPGVDRKKHDHGEKTGFLEGFFQEPSPSSPSPSLGAKSVIPPQKNSALPSGVAAATPTYPDPEQAPPPLPPRPTQPPSSPSRDKSESSSMESDSGSDSDSDMDILLPSDVRSSAGRPAKSKYEMEVERERNIRREAMIREWERLREEQEKEESAMRDIRAYRVMREQKEAQKREAERRETERREAERRGAERREAERREAEKKEMERREAEKKEMQRREEEREELRLESQRAAEIEVEMKRERILQAKIEAEKESPAAVRENKEEWDWSGTDTPTAEDIYKTSQYPPVRKYFVLTRNPSTNDFNFAPLPLALSHILHEPTTPMKVLENMQSPERFIGYWGAVQRLGFEIVAGERECVIVCTSIEDADEKMQSMLQEIEGMREFQGKPALEDAAPPKGLDAIATDIAGKIGFGGKPPPVVEEAPKVFEEFSSLVGEATKPIEREPEPVEQETVNPIEEITEPQEARGPRAPEEDFKLKPSDAKRWDQVTEDAKYPEVAREKIEPGPVQHEVIVTPPMKTAAEDPVETETNNAWQDKYQFTENPEKVVQQSTEAPKVVEETLKAEEPAKECEITTAADPSTFAEKQSPTTQSPSPEETTPETFLSPASEVARENWEKKRGSPPSPTPAEELLTKPALEKSSLAAPAPANSQQQQKQQQQGKSKQGKKPKRKIFWTSVWVAAATGGTSLLLENYC